MKGIYVKEPPSEQIETMKSTVCENEPDRIRLKLLWLSLVLDMRHTRTGINFTIIQKEYSKHAWPILFIYLTVHAATERRHAR